MQKPFSANYGSQQHLSSDHRMWLMFVHLAVFANCIAPGLAIAAPLIIWQVKKDEIPEMDAHGKMVLNFLISTAIYTVVGIVLLLLLIGIPLLIAISIWGIVLPIVGAIKANNGEYWEYPLVIQFVK